MPSQSHGSGTHNCAAENKPTRHAPSNTSLKSSVFGKSARGKSKRMQSYVSMNNQQPFKRSYASNQLPSLQKENLMLEFSKRYRITEKIIKFLELNIRDGVYLQRRSAPILILFICLVAINVCICLALWIRKISFVECEIPYYDQPVSDTGITTIMVTHKECNKDNNFNLLDSDEIFVYYKITNYPHLESSHSSDDIYEQLAGHVISGPESLDYFTPFDTIEHKGVTKLLHPRGVHAWNVFNDKINFYNSMPTESSATPIEIDESIPISSMPLEIQHFKNPSKDDVNKYEKSVYFWMLPGNEKSIDVGGNDENLAKTLYNALNYEKCGEGVENSHFATWMSGTPFSSFKKYYGKIKGPLKLPLYISIENRYNVLKFNGTKSIILSIPKWPYGSSLSLEIIQLIFTVITLVFTVFYATKNTLASTNLQMYYESKLIQNKT